MVVYADIVASRNEKLIMTTDGPSVDALELDVKVDNILGIYDRNDKEALFHEECDHAMSLMLEAGGLRSGAFHDGNRRNFLPQTVFELAASNAVIEKDIELWTKVCVIRQLFLKWNGSTYRYSTDEVQRCNDLVGDKYEVLKNIAIKTPKYMKWKIKARVFTIEIHTESLTPKIKKIFHSVELY